MLSRDLHRRGIDPPVDVLASLSRLMNAGIGDGRTREDHRPLADQLYALVARAGGVRRLASIVGEAGLSTRTAVRSRSASTSSSASSARAPRDGASR